MTWPEAAVEISDNLVLVAWWFAVAHVFAAIFRNRAKGD